MNSMSEPHSQQLFLIFPGKKIFFGQKKVKTEKKKKKLFFWSKKVKTEKKKIFFLVKKGQKKGKKKTNFYYEILPGPSLVVNCK